MKAHTLHTFEFEDEAELQEVLARDGRTGAAAHDLLLGVLAHGDAVIVRVPGQPACVVVHRRAIDAVIDRKLDGAALVALPLI